MCVGRVVFGVGGRAGARKPHSGHYWRVVGLVTESSQTTGILRKQQGSVAAWGPGPLIYHRVEGASAPWALLGSSWTRSFDTPSEITQNHGGGLATVLED